MSYKRDLVFGIITEDSKEDTQSILRHPLHVGISRTDAVKIKHTAEEFVGMITTLPPREEKKSIFVFTSVINERDEADENSVKLYVTRIFLEHYSLQSNVRVYFKTIYTLPLEKIVIGVTKAETYKYIQDQEWATALLLSLCKSKILIRTKDAWLSTHIFDPENVNCVFDIAILDCSPVSQGILDVKTNIVIIKTRREAKLPNNCVQVAKQSLNFDIKRTCSLPFCTIPYVSPKIQDKYLVPQNYKVEIIPQLPLNIRDGIRIEGVVFDPLAAVFISRSCMFSYKLVEGNWVIIRLMPSVEDRKLNSNNVLALTDENEKFFYSEHFRYARIFSVEEWLYKDFETVTKRNIAFISPLLWFNLNNHPSPLLQPTAEISIEILDPGFKLPNASEVYISMVQSPEINTTVDCSTLRKNYFKIPRVVCSGDVLAISSSVDIMFHEKVEETPNFRWPVVYFKISLINSSDPSPCFLADNHSCSIYEAGTKQSYVPVTMDAYYSPFPVHPIWEVPRPAGIDAYVEHLQSIVSPYLKLENARQINPHILLMGNSGCGKSVIVKSLCRSLNMHLYQVNCYDLVGGIPGSSEARIKAIFERVTTYAPCVMLLRNIEAVAKVKDDEDPRILNAFVENLKKLNETLDEWPVIVIGTSIKSQVQHSELFTIMLHHIKIEVPSEAERKLILEALFGMFPLANDVSLSYIAQRTVKLNETLDEWPVIAIATSIKSQVQNSELFTIMLHHIKIEGFILGDFTALLAKTLMAAYNRMKQKTLELSLTWKEESDISYAGIFVLQKDIIKSVEELQSVHAHSVGAPMIPNVRWEDVGGLADVKQEILDTIQLPLQHPELLNAGLRRSGVLLYGPPGTGKTLLAKAVATECCLNFLSVKGPELINMYVGQSEENVREVFHSARSTSPCVIFFDELDSLAPNRGRSGDSGGVMDRVVSQLLAELDGLSKSTEVFVIGATNRPDLLDPALLRPGRFDRLVYVGISEDAASRINILKALCHKMPLSQDVSLDEIEKKCVMNLSGADFYSLCSNALMNAVGRCVQRIENGEQESDVHLSISQEDFDVAVTTLVPSVSAEELRRFADIKQSFTS